MPILGKQRLGHWNGIIKKVSLEEAPLIFASLFPPSEFSSLFFFSSSNISKKQLFDKGFNIDCCLLAENYVGEDINLSFAEYHYLLAIKTNKL